MKEIILDGRAMTDRAAAHREIKEKMGFPDYYGGNLDALWDMLTTYEEADVRMYHPGKMLNNLQAYGCRILLTFYQAAKEHPQLQFSVISGHHHTRETMEDMK